MRQLTVAILLIVAIALQSALRAVWQPLGYLDFTLVLVVYFALQREPFLALITAAVVASRVMLDTTLLRIPVLFCASAIDNLVYVGMHRLFGQLPPMPFVQSLSYKLIATTVSGTILLYLYDSYFSSKARQRRQFTVRRRVARRPSAAARRR